MRSQPLSHAALDADAPEIALSGENDCAAMNGGEPVIALRRAAGAFRRLKNGQKCGCENDTKSCARDFAREVMTCHKQKENGHG